MSNQYNDPKGKAGSLKAPLGLVPPTAMEQTAWVHKLGADKYGPWNWRKTGVCASTYVNAILRHLNAWRDGEDLDPESGFSHLAHIACSCNILMDAAKVGKLQDDRNKLPTNGEAEEDSSIEGILQEWLESARKDLEDFGFELSIDDVPEPDTVPEYRILFEDDRLQDGDEVYVGEGRWLPLYIESWATPAYVNNGTYRRKITKCDLKEEPEYRTLKVGEIIQEGDERCHKCGNDWAKTAILKSDQIRVSLEDIYLYRRKITDCDLKEEPETCCSESEPQDMGECTCGRRYIYHWLYGWLCEDCDLKPEQQYP